MKTNKLLGVIALLAIIATAIIGCKGDDPATEEQPVLKTATLTLGNATVKVEYNDLPSAGEPEFIARFRNRFTTITPEEDNPFLTSLGNKTYTIKIIDSSTDGFQKVDDTTLSIGKEYPNLSTITGTAIIAGFKLLPGITS